jgi:hypothetical protein
MATKAKKGKVASAVDKPVAVPLPTNASEVPSVYANIFEMLSMNHIDVRFGFDEVVLETGNKPTTFRRANVVMSVPAFLTMVQIVQVHAQN